MPQANTLFIGRVPPATGWSQGPKTIRPIVIDTDRVHPLMQYIEMGDVLIVEGTPLKAPTGGTALIDADIGPVYAIAPREGFEDAALGFEILGPDDKGQVEPKTDWVIRRSFPVFAMNVVRYLGGVRARRRDVVGQAGTANGPAHRVDGGPRRRCSVPTASAPRCCASAEPIRLHEHGPAGNLQCV